MRPLALKRAVAPERRFGRAPLAIKLAIAFVGLVAFVLIVNGAIDTYLTYNQAKRAALEVESEKARAAAERVGVFLDEIQTELGWTAGIEWGYAKPEQQRYDFIRLLRQTPAITALSYIDGHGKEQLAVSRLAPDTVASGKDFSADPRFVRAVADKVWFGPVEFRRGSEPYMTVALAHIGKAPGVTVADVNLKLIWDVINAIHVGDKGFAYVVDGKGRLIAHPDLSLVLRDTDLSALPQVRAAMAGRGASQAEVARSLDGASVLTAHAVVPRTHWTVFVEQPLAEALATAYRSLLRSLALLGFGLALAVVSGVALARRMAAPIRLLQAGAEKLGSGDLAQRLDIRTGDEIEALAGGFNRMAERLQESYETLEAKVEERTKDLNEALAQQTATADVLKVISRSVFDLEGVFKTLLTTAVSLVGGIGGAIALREGDRLRFRAGVSPQGFLSTDFVGRLMEIDRTSAAGRALLSGRTEYIPDAALDAEFHSVASGAWGKSYLGVPLTRDGKAEGALTMLAEHSHAFTPRHIELIQTFADQAVIAIENVRLFDQVQARTRDLEDALAKQTSTAEILRVISQSPTDARPVFESIVVAAARLLRCDMAFVMLVEGETWRNAAVATPEGLGKVVLTETFPVNPNLNFPSQAIVARQMVSLPDWSAIPMPDHQRRVRDLYGIQASLHLPFLREGECIGVLTLLSRRAFAFGEAEILQSHSFRDQALIAVENARLFNETQESLAQQTATAEVLKVISRSVFDLDSVLQTLIDTAVRLTHGNRGTIFLKQDDVLVARAFHSNVPDQLRAYLTSTPWRLDGDSHMARAVRERAVVHIADLSKSEIESDHEVQKRASFGAGLWTPLMRKGEVIGVFGVPRDEPIGFTPREIELVQTFADQAVIAIENARLFEEVQARTRELEQSLADLRKAQDRLVQSEKLASLGQLTAGIAHEIKNPLNFVNNFASLSRELLEELRETLQRLPEDAKTDADDLMGMIDSNLEKVASHGRRADSIVKNMLLHSREGSGERSRVNVNAMVEEALNLGYHGARAEKPGFNVTVEKDFDPRAGEADIYLQEVTRVLLNLISNGFYATDKRRQAEGPGYEPTLKATTRGLGHNVEIRIRDNGTGIPDEVRAKMFNPFFTTKPAGEGTGLGLSLSHDIVVKQHGGTLDVETAPGAFTEFVITLPRAGAGA